MDLSNICVFSSTQQTVPCMCAIPCFLLISGRNPVFRLEGNVFEDAMKNITDPVAAFLSSDDFTSVVPEGIEVITSKTFQTTYS